MATIVGQVAGKVFNTNVVSAPVGEAPSYESVITPVQTKGPVTIVSPDVSGPEACRVTTSESGYLEITGDPTSIISHRTQTEVHTIVSPAILGSSQNWTIQILKANSQQPNKKENE